MFTVPDIRTSLSVAESVAQPNTFACASGELILNTYICDGTLDCLSGDDESSCGKSSIYNLRNWFDDITFSNILYFALNLINSSTDHIYLSSERTLKPSTEEISSTVTIQIPGKQLCWRKYLHQKSRMVHDALNSLTYSGKLTSPVMITTYLGNYILTTKLRQNHNASQI